MDKDKGLIKPVDGLLGEDAEDAEDGVANDGGDDDDDDEEEEEEERPHRELRQRNRRQRQRLNGASRGAGNRGAGNRGAGNHGAGNRGAGNLGAGNPQGQQGHQAQRQEQLTKPWLPHEEIHLEDLLNLGGDQGQRELDYLVRRNARRVTLQEMMEHPDASYANTWFIGIILSESLAKPGSEGRHVQDNRNRGADGRVNNHQTIRYTRMIRIACLASQVGSIQGCGNNERMFDIQLNLRDNGVFGSILFVIM